MCDILGCLEGFLEPGGDNEGHDCSGKLTDSLHCEYGTHHGTAPFGVGKSITVSRRV